MLACECWHVCRRGMLAGRGWMSPREMIMSRLRSHPSTVSSVVLQCCSGVLAVECMLLALINLGRC